MKNTSFRLNLEHDIISFQSQKSLLNHVYGIVFWSSITSSCCSASPSYITGVRKRETEVPRVPSLKPSQDRLGDSKAHKASAPTKERRTVKTGGGDSLEGGFG